MANFKPEQSLEEMLKIMNKNDGNTEVIHAGASFIQYKLQEKLLKDQEDRHKELLKNQNTYNRKQLFWTKILAIAAILSSVFSLYFGRI